MTKRIYLITIFSVITITSVFGQARQTPLSQQFREASRLIRIAEPGQLADSINVWGDISAGRYLIPRGTTLLELLTYGTGPNTINDSQTRLDWSRMRVEVYLNDFNKETGEFDATTFTYRFEEPLPAEMETIQLKNNQTVIIRVKRKPAFRDYVSVVAPVISAVATTFLALSRIRDL